MTEFCGWSFVHFAAVGQTYNRYQIINEEVIPPPMKYSVIIPSYNRSLQLMLTLTAFEKQTYPKDQFEVIVVNDGSTDDTLERLQQYSVPYRLAVVNLAETSGRSAARNRGVAEANGEYIIFCDPDFLVSPNFIHAHDSYHQQHSKAVVSGVPYLFMNAYTQLHPDFSEEEKMAMAGVLLPAGLWGEHFWHTNERIEIVTREDILNDTDRLLKVIAPWEPVKSHYDQFHTTDVAPWLMAITRNLSLSKQLFDRVGGFNEAFQKHGLEDWELGYRLHRSGCTFISMKEPVGYHQEHPSGHRTEDTQGENIRIMFKTHGFVDPELSLFAVMSPSEGIEAYKNMLRILQAWRKSKRASLRYAAKQVRRACTRSARLFYKSPNSPEYERFKTVLKEAFTAAHAIYAEPQVAGKSHRIKAILSQACRSLMPVPRKSLSRRSFARKLSTRRAVARKRKGLRTRKRLSRR